MIGWIRARRAELRARETIAHQMVLEHGLQAHYVVRDRMVETHRARDWDANTRWTRIARLIEKEIGPKPRGGWESGFIPPL